MTGPRRLADDGLPHPRRPALLRRHLLPPPRPATARRASGGSSTRVDDAWRDRRGRDRVARPTSWPTPSVGRPDPRRPDRRARRRTRSPARAVRRSLAAAAAELVRRFDRALGRVRAGAEIPPAAPGRAVLFATTRVTGAGRRSPWPPRRSRRWRPGGSTTIWAAVSPATPPTSTWTVPHFEKMLYDQAGLVRVYLHAWQATGRPVWLQVVEETLDYVLAELASPRRRPVLGPGRRLRGRGGALLPVDAGRAGRRRARARLGRTSPPTGTGSPQAGNFEGRTILRRPLGAPLPRPARRSRQARLAACSRPAGTRVHPGLDDKVLTEWNAMFGSSLAEAAGATGRHDWADAARSGSPSSCWRELRPARDRTVAAVVAGRPGPTPRLRRRLRLAGRVLHPVGRARPATARLARPRAGDGAGPCSSCSAGEGDLLYTTGNDAERLRRPPTRPPRRRRPVRQRGRRRGAAPARARCAATIALTDAGASLLRTLAPGAPPSTRWRAPTAWPRSSSSGGGITEVVIPGDRPDLLATARARFEPTMVLAWGEPHVVAAVGRTRRGLAYVCRHFVCRHPPPPRSSSPRRLDDELAATVTGPVTAMTADAELGDRGASGAPARDEATTAADAGGRDAQRRLPPQVPGAHRCMVLACTDEDTTAVDLHTGAVVRLRVDWGEERDPDLAAPRRSSTSRGPTTPSATTWPSPRRSRSTGVPVRARRRRGPPGPPRAAALVAIPPQQHLLGFPGSSAPYWEFRGMRPSVAVVVPSRGPVIFRRREDDTVWARFGWPRERQLAPDRGPPGHRCAGSGPSRPAVGEGPRDGARLPAPLSRGGAQPAA